MVQEQIAEIEAKLVKEREQATKLWEAYQAAEKVYFQQFAVVQQLQKEALALFLKSKGVAQ